MPTYRIVVEGKVQGVFYRAAAREKGMKLGLSGWIRNTPDNAVEMMVNGIENDVEQFVDWCRRGPKNAVVQSIEIKQVDEEVFKGFEIRR